MGHKDTGRPPNSGGGQGRRDDGGDRMEQAEALEPLAAEAGNIPGTVGSTVEG